MLNSLLIADCGAVATKVGLIDRVAGEYRLLGAARVRTTVTPPHGNVMHGVRQAIQQLENLTGRLLLDAQGELIKPERAGGEGVDAFTAVVSAAPPLRAALVGLARDYSVACAHQALRSTYAIVEHTIAVDEESGRWGTTASDGRAGGPSAAVEKLAASQPDVIVMVGGTDGGAVAPLLEMANIVAALAAATDPQMRPLVIFAGNAEASSQVAARIGDLVPVTSIENVLPALDHQNPNPLRNEIKRLYDQRQVTRIPGLEKLRAWSGVPVMTAADALSFVAQYLARKYQLRVLAADMGAGTTSLIYRADDLADAAGEPAWQELDAHTSMGLGLHNLVREGAQELAPWLPAAIPLEQAHAQLLNQSIRPWTVPECGEDHAVLNAAGRQLLRDLHQRHAQSENGQGRRSALDADLVILTGAPIVRGSKPAALMLMLLDALELQGVFSMAADPLGLLPALGALGLVNPEAAAQVVENDGLVTWGTVIAPAVTSPGGERTALLARVMPVRGGRFDVDVKLGSLELIALGEGERAQVELRPRGGVELGLPLKGGALKREVQGGTVGLLIDGRGRPIPQLENLARQRERVQAWMWEVGA